LTESKPQSVENQHVLEDSINENADLMDTDILASDVNPNHLMEEPGREASLNLSSDALHN
jgi:hypothetical protein